VVLLNRPACRGVACYALRADRAYRVVAFLGHHGLCTVHAAAWEGRRRGDQRETRRAAPFCHGGWARHASPLQAAEQAKDDLKDHHRGGGPDKVQAHPSVAGDLDAFDGLDQ